MIPAGATRATDPPDGTALPTRPSAPRYRRARVHRWHDGHQNTLRSLVALAPSEPL